MRTNCTVGSNVLCDYNRIAFGRTDCERIRSPQYGVDRRLHAKYVGDQELRIYRGDARA